VKRIFIILGLLPLLALGQWLIPEKDRLEDRVELYYQATFAADLETMYELESPVIRSIIDFEAWKKDRGIDKDPADGFSSEIQQFDIKSYDWCGEYGKEYRCVIVVHLVVETDGIVEEGDLKALWILDGDEWYYGLPLHH
jgi:hypothetical protein